MSTVGLTPSSSMASSVSATALAPAVVPLPTLKDKIPKLEPRRRRQQTSNSTPVPEIPTLPPPPDTAGLTFEVPVRRILSKEDHAIFLRSPACTLVKAWIFGLAEAVADVPCSAVRDAEQSKSITAILAILDEVDSFVAKNPPDEQGGSRFGNAAFRGFVDDVEASASRWHQELGLQDPAAIAEVSTYLNEAFGSRSRIDYGSGHELNFLMWLLCLYQLKVVQKSDFKVLIARVFVRYLEIMRSAQMTYYLEPAGSHGVWGLDDYQFLPFLFGASQLLNHPYITPRAIHQDLMVEEFNKDYLYLGQVDFVNSTKTVKGLRWHSPMLDDISSAKSWSKINDGMRRMFVAEVLGKLPVMQHFLFGSLIPAADGMTLPELPIGPEDEMAHQHSDSHDDHSHEAVGWGDCCGIKVPSSIAAAQELRKKGEKESLRRIPFD